jgi:hypothetical protein
MDEEREKEGGREKGEREGGVREKEENVSLQHGFSSPKVHERKEGRD